MGSGIKSLDGGRAWGFEILMGRKRSMRSVGMVEGLIFDGEGMGDVMGGES